MLHPQNATEACHEQGRSTFRDNQDMSPIRCPYCVEGESFKAMVAQGNSGDWHMCVRCGHLILPTNPSFECTCANCVTLKSLLSTRRETGAVKRFTSPLM